LLPVKSITTVYNAIHTPNYLPKNQARDILGIPKQATVIGTIANYYRRKGLDLLIDAFQELKLDPSVVCLIIGEGPERTHLESRILPANKHQIRLYGPIEQASSYLKALDIFVLPSRFEGFPYVLLEALAAGLPIISSNAGGSAEAVGNAGLIVPTNNTTELAHAIEKLLSNGQLRKEYEQRSTTQASHFTKTKMQEETRLVYESLLKNN
jgi:glycosyltransferase involved in cell wall biosynthesis